MIADNLLSRLHKVKRNGANKWMACCPAHDDRTPSLAIRVTDDNRILIHCFAGCDPLSILNAISMGMADLQPRLTADQYHPFAFAKVEMAQRKKQQEELRRHQTIIALANDDIKQGKPLSQSDIEELRRSVKYMRENGNG